LATDVQNAKVRKTHTQQLCAPSNAANLRSWARRFPGQSAIRKEFTRRGGKSQIRNLAPSPHEKKKNLLRQKSNACPEPKRYAIHARHFKVRRTVWGNFAHLGHLRFA
jgi:hypothetical protein